MLSGASGGSQELSWRFLREANQSKDRPQKVTNGEPTQESSRGDCIFVIFATFCSNAPPKKGFPQRDQLKLEKCVKS
jgi:hypothetical protein